MKTLLRTLAFVVPPAVIGFTWANLALWEDRNASYRSVTTPDTTGEFVPAATFMTEAFLSAFAVVAVAQLLIVLCALATNFTRRKLARHRGEDCAPPRVSFLKFIAMPALIAFVFMAVPVHPFFFNPYYEEFYVVDEAGWTWQPANALGFAGAYFALLVVAFSIIKTIAVAFHTIIVVTSTYAERRSKRIRGH